VAEPETFYGKYVAPGRRAGVARPSDVQKVRATLAAVNEQVAALPNAALRRMRPVIDAARMQLERDLARWLHTVEDGSLRFTAYHKRSLLLQLRESMRLIDTMTDTMSDTLATGSQAAAGMATSVLRQEVARFAAVFDGSIPSIDIPTVAHLTDQNSWLLERYRRKSGAYTAEFKKRINRQLSIGVAQRETTHELAMRLVREAGTSEGAALASQIKRMEGLFAGGQGGISVQVDTLAKQMANGLGRSAYTNAERLVRTELMHAYNQHTLTAAMDAHREDPEIMLRWDASSDRMCTLCHALDGEVVVPGQPFSSGHLKPPRHPNCRCRASEWMSHWAEVKPLGGGPGAAVVTRGGTAKETNAVLRNRRPR